MLNNLLYLIDTHSISLVVKLFIMTINNNGNIILRFVSELGKLGNLNNFFSEDAYIAVKEVEYQNENSEFVKSVLPEYTRSSVVAATIIGEESDLKPFGISILQNNMILKKPKITPISNNDSVVLATLNAAKIKASNNMGVGVLGDKANCTYFEFCPTAESKTFDILNLSAEKQIKFANMEVVKEKSRTIFGDFITYKNREFDEEWRKKALLTLNEYFLDNNTKLIPRTDGLWYEEYIEWKSFPYWIIGNSYKKEDWIKFLSDPTNFPVDVGKFLKAG